MEEELQISAGKNVKIYSQDLKEYVEKKNYLDVVLSGSYFFPYQINRGKKTGLLRPVVTPSFPDHPPIDSVPPVKYLERQ